MLLIRLANTRVRPPFAWMYPIRLDAPAMPIAGVRKATRLPGLASILPTDGVPLPSVASVPSTPTIGSAARNAAPYGWSWHAPQERRDRDRVDAIAVVGAPAVEGERHVRRRSQGAALLWRNGKPAGQSRWPCLTATRHTRRSAPRFALTLRMTFTICESGADTRSADAATRRVAATARQQVARVGPYRPRGDGHAGATQRFDERGAGEGSRVRDEEHL